MAVRVRHIATRFALLLGVAAVVPLLAYGFVSLWSLQRGTRDSVTAGNQNVATRVAEEIRRYVATNAALLKALAADLQNTGLDVRQQDQILKNYVLAFREFREISLFQESGASIATSRIGAPRVAIPKSPGLSIDGVSMSPIRVDEDMLPTSTFAIHLTRLNQPDGWLVGEFSLEEMWRMVDQIRIRTAPPSWAWRRASRFSAGPSSSSSRRGRRTPAPPSCSVSSSSRSRWRCS
jgi:hypothetical protein